MARQSGPDPQGRAALPPDLDPRGRRAARRAEATPGQRARSTVRRVGTVGRVVAAVLSLVILVGSGYAWATYQKFNSQHRERQRPGVQRHRRRRQGPEHPADRQRQPRRRDRRGTAGAVHRGRRRQRQHRHHDPAARAGRRLPGQPDLVPRDSYVDIPGYGSDRINAAYSNAYTAAKGEGKSEVQSQSAGIALTAATISQLTGLTIDHYLQVNLLGFYRISVALDGVDVCLNAAQQDPFSGIDLPAGVSHIEGKQALAFVRQRHGLPRGDLDRIARQQYFLGAVFRKVSSAGTLINPFKLNDLLDAVSSSLLKDPSLDLITLAQQVQDLQAGNITFATIPTTGNENIDGQDVLGVDPAQVQQEVQQIIGNTADAVAKAPAVDPASFSVDVLNGSDTAGAATSNADLLTGAGFTVGTVGNFDGGADATQIRFPTGMAAQAKTLGALVPGVSYVQTSSVDAVTLVIGANGVGVKDPSAAPATTSAAAPPAETAGAAATGTRSGSDISCIN